MHERVLTADHEAGHLVIGALGGKRPKRVQVENTRGVIEYSGHDEPTSPPAAFLLGAVDAALMHPTPSPCLSPEQATLAAYSGWSLEANLLCLLAGVEASGISATRQQWDTTLLRLEREDYRCGDG